MQEKSKDLQPINRWIVAIGHKIEGIMIAYYIPGVVLQGDHDELKLKIQTDERFVKNVGIPMSCLNHNFKLIPAEKVIKKKPLK